MIRSRRWAVATVALATVIFATLELAPRLWGWFLPRAGRHLPQAATAAAGCVSALVALRAWSLEPKLWRARRILLLILCLAGAALALATVLAGTTPAAKVHLVEYGVLAWWCLNAVRADRVSMAAALAVVIALGAIDEGVQHLLPSRYFDVRDILGNWWATGLGAVAWYAASVNSPLNRDPGGESCGQP